MLYKKQTARTTRRCSPKLVFARLRDADNAAREKVGKRQCVLRTDSCVQMFCPGIVAGVSAPWTESHPLVQRAERSRGKRAGAPFEGKRPCLIVVRTSVDQSRV